MNLEVKEWWGRAESDIDTARYLYKGNKFEEICRELSVIYIFTRYPGVADIKDLSNKAAKYLNATEKILQWIKEKLS